MGVQAAVEKRAEPGSQLLMEFNTNPALLGGLVVKLGESVYDQSVASRLERMQTQPHRRTEEIRVVLLGASAPKSFTLVLRSPAAWTHPPGDFPGSSRQGVMHRSREVLRHPRCPC